MACISTKSRKGLGEKVAHAGAAAKHIKIPGRANAAHS